jgi:hypothetical protein
MNQVKTAETKVWLPPFSSLKPAQLRSAKAGELVNTCAYSDHDMTSEGWVQIGTATISLELLPPEDLTAHQVAALRKQQGELIAKANQVEGQIQQLLAIEHDAPEFQA